ncbi:YIP1 family protein, partial [Acidobacteriota bacterium]
TEKLIVPFEDKSKNFFTGLLETMKLVLFQPTNFFRNYKLDGTMGKPILFALIVGWVSAIISSTWSMFIGDFTSTVLQWLRDRLPEFEGVEWEQLEQWEQLGATDGTFDLIFGIIMAPFFILFFLFIFAGIYHLFLMLVKGANKNFETTFNVVAYGTAAQIAEIIPFLGTLIAWGYGIVLSIIGLTEAHETDSWKAVFAIFTPIILCLFCCWLFMMILGGAGGLAPLLKQLQ